MISLGGKSLFSILATLAALGLTIAMMISIGSSFYKLQYGPYIDTEWDFTRCAPLSDNPKRVWAFWGSGPDTMTAFTQESVKMWKQFTTDEWEIRIINNLPDKTNDCHYSNYVSQEHLPKQFEDMIAQHQSDAVRLALMRLYGGVYIDVSLLLFGPLETMFWDRLNLPEDHPNKTAIAGFMSLNIQYMFEVWMFAALAQEPLIIAWHELYLKLKNSDQPEIRNSVTGEIHPLLKGFDDYGLNQHSLKYFCVSWVLKALLDTNLTLANRFKKQGQIIITDDEPFRQLYVIYGTFNIEFWTNPTLIVEDAYEMVRDHFPIFKFFRHGYMFGDTEVHKWRNLHTNIGKFRKLISERALEWRNQPHRTPLEVWPYPKKSI